MHRARVCSSPARPPLPTSLFGSPSPTWASSPSTWCAPRPIGHYLSLLVTIGHYWSLSVTIGDGHESFYWFSIPNVGILSKYRSTAGEFNSSPK
eukprot:1112820-Prorocentrum_minimum.AAC.7